MNVLNRVEAPRRVIEVIAEALQIPKEQIKTEARFVEDLGLELWGAIVAFNALEEKLGVQIPDKAIAKLLTIQETIDFVLEQAEPAVVAPAP